MMWGLVGLATATVGLTPEVAQYLELRDYILILCFGFRYISSVDLLDWFFTNLIIFYLNFLMSDLFY